MTTLRGVTWEHERGHGSVVSASEAYSSEEGSVRIEWHARSLQSFADQPLESLAAEYDLLVIDHPHVAGAAEAGLLAPLDDFMPSTMTASAFIGRSHESYRYRGAQYGLATDAAAQVAAYRPDLLETVPRRWADVLELARANRVLWPAKPIDAFSSLITVLAGSGARVMVPGGPFVEREVFENAWPLLAELADLVPNRCLALNPIEIAEELASESRYAYAPLLFGYTNYSRPGYRDAVLAYTDIPVRSSGDAPTGSLLGGAGIAVSATSSELREAAAFAVWLASAETQRGSYFAGGGQPGRIEAWMDPELDAAATGFFSGTRRTLEGATVRPRHPGYMTFQDEASPLVTRALAHEIGAAHLADQLDELFRTHVGDSNADR